MWHDNIMWEKNVLTFYLSGQVNSGDCDTQYLYRVRVKVVQRDVGQNNQIIDSEILELKRL